MDLATQIPPRTEDLLIGVLAVIALQGRDTLKTSDKVFHSAFARALDVFSQKGNAELVELADSYYQDVVTNKYEELDDALIAAERFSLLRFPNPTYSRLQVTMTPRVAEEFLNKYPDQRATFEEAAHVLLEHLI